MKYDILLIEDNPTDAELTITTLTTAKISNNIFWVADGEQAIDFLLYKNQYKDREHHIPKLILLDIQLPKINGFEVLQALRSNDETKFIPIVVITSSSEEQDIIKSYNLGANSFVTKPIKFDEFSKAMINLGFYWLFVNKRIYE